VRNDLVSFHDKEEQMLEDTILAFAIAFGSWILWSYI